jgi:membrane protease YdiL (CAAX protease family)
MLHNIAYNANQQRGAHVKTSASIFWFVLFTIALSFAAFFIPLPEESRALIVPVILTFIPTIVCVPLAYFTEGSSGLRQLFSSANSGFKWLLIGVLVGAGMRVAVLIVGLVAGTSIKADLSVPGTWFVVLVTIPLAYFEELGWRRFALDRLFKSRSPFESSLLLGLPWAIIHLVILLPRMMSVGAPAIPQTVVLICLSVIVTWAYVRSGGSVFTTTLVHGVQNGLVVLNRGIGIADATWLMMWTYLLLAFIFVIGERRTFFAKPASV